jgi:hypothetical protein
MSHRTSFAFIAAVLIGGASLAGSSGCSSDLPACPADGALTTLPFDANRLDHIVPLGQLNPPGHTIPTAHMYWNVTNPGTQRTELRAPGAIIVTHVKRSEFSYTQDDYAIRFDVCEDLGGELSHVTELSPKLEEALGAFRCDPERTVADGTVTDCVASGRVSFEPGEVIGYIGDLPDNMGVDFGMSDRRITHTFMNEDRFSHMLHYVAAYDYFTDSIKSQLAGYLGTLDGSRRTLEPLGGEYAYDVAGTARGSWYRIDGVTAFDDDYAIAMAPDNVFPDVMAFSIANVGTDEDATVLYFDPLDSGFVRRSFADVVADGNVYCFDELYYDRALTSPSPSAIKVEVLEGETLNVEIVAGSCGAAPFGFDESEMFTMER